MSIEELIAALEQASEGSRELDAKVAIVTGISTHETVYSAIACMCSAHYTTSIDAAMTLVPEGCWWAMRPAFHLLSPRHPAGFDATVASIDYEDEEIDWYDNVPVEWRVLRGFKVGAWEGWHKSKPPATAPLALCIAALKARSRQP